MEEKRISCELYLIWGNGTWTTECFDIPECLLTNEDTYETKVERWWLEVYGWKAQYQDLSAVKIYSIHWDTEEESNEL